MCSHEKWTDGEKTSLIGFLNMCLSMKLLAGVRSHTAVYKRHSFLPLITCMHAVYFPNDENNVEQLMYSVYVIKTTLIWYSRPPCRKKCCAHASIKFYVVVFNERKQATLICSAIYSQQQ